MIKASKKEIILNIGGMTCASCQDRIERKLNRTEGIIKAQVSYSDNRAKIVYDENKISLEKIHGVIKNLGYEIGNSSSVLDKLNILAIIIIVYVFLQTTGILNFLVPSQLADSKMSYGMLFIIGIFTSMHCVAMCGGINLSQALTDIKTFRPIFSYNFGRIISYAITGGILGLLSFVLGQVGNIKISLNFQASLKIFAGVFMIIMGFNMLNLFPSLKKCNFRIPKFFSDKIFFLKLAAPKPFIVGLLNGLMPCGPLQSMWLVALATGSPRAGALSMLFFGLGTLPLMLGLGSIIASLGRKGKNFAKKITTSGAILVTVLGFVMTSQGVNLSGNFQLQTQDSLPVPQGLENLQIVKSTLSSGTYPDINVKSGQPVQWEINAPKGSINGCNYKFIIHEYGIEHTFKTGDNVINFTPTKPGTVRYSCWMGMIRGNIFVES